MSKRFAAPSGPSLRTRSTRWGSKPWKADGPGVLAIERMNLACRSRRGSMRPLQRLGLDGPRSLGFGAQHGPRRDVSVPLDQRRNPAAPLHHETVEVPHGRGDMALVRVEQMGSLVGVAREVNLTDPIDRH